MMKDAGSDRVPKYLEVVFILQDGLHALCLPNINNGVRNHASVATSCCCAKRVGVINIEVVGQTLDNKPGFVGRKDWAGAMEFFDIKGTGLSPRGSISHLNRSKRRLIRKMDKDTEVIRQVKGQTNVDVA